ncbi:hypothetical protein ACFL0C_01795, partial [Patescibacteria group bacterium]
GFSMDDNLKVSQQNKYVLPRVGVDSSHSFEDFQASITPPVILFRKLVKKLIGIKVLDSIGRKVYA